MNGTFRFGQICRQNLLAHLEADPHHDLTARCSSGAPMVNPGWEFSLQGVRWRGHKLKLKLQTRMARLKYSQISQFLFFPARSVGIRFLFIALALAASTASAVEMPLPDLRPPHDEIAPTFWEVHRWQLGGGSLGILMLVGVIVFLVRRPRIIVVEPAATTVRRELEALRGRPADGALVVEVSRVLRRYIRTALNFPPDELTTTEIRHALQNHRRINSELAAATGDFLRRCDEWKFAPDASKPGSDVVQNAVELVEKIEVTRKPPPIPQPANTAPA